MTNAILIRIMYCIVLQYGYYNHKYVPIKAKINEYGSQVSRIIATVNDCRHMNH